MLKIVFTWSIIYDLSYKEIHSGSQLPLHDIKRILVAYMEKLEEAYT